MRVVLIAASVLVLSGCSPAAPDESLPPSAVPPAVDCLTVSAGSLDAIRVGVQMIEPGNDVGSAAAIAVNDMWFVAAEVTGAGMTPQVGVWVTQNDPTTSESNAYNSVDGVAANFSDYVQSPFYDVTSAGIDEVESCI